jgi:hypothetical protein
LKISSKALRFSTFYCKRLCMCPILMDAVQFLLYVFKILLQISTSPSRAQVTTNISVSSFSMPRRRSPVTEVVDVVHEVTEVDGCFALAS